MRLFIYFYFYFIFCIQYSEALFGSGLRQSNCNQHVQTSSSSLSISEITSADTLTQHIVLVGHGKADKLIVLSDDRLLHLLSPDFKLLSNIQCRGIAVTARSSDNRYDYVARFFAPKLGIDEDSVSGSAHCLLVTYWNTILKKTKLKGFQASKRGGIFFFSQNVNAFCQTTGHDVK